MKIAIIGTVGVPGRYGGFETLADNLVRHHVATGNDDALTVYCSAPTYPDKPLSYLSAKLRYSRFKANGAQSVPYDALTLLDAAARRHDVLLLLGVSGAIVLPFLRLVSRARIVTNVDGIEWRRAKWTGPARWFLRLSEHFAVRFSHVVIADNKSIADYLSETYRIESEVIAYGGDHAVENVAAVSMEALGDMPLGYALALCRIEPENNVAMILEAYANSGRPLVFVGNWNASAYGRTLRKKYSRYEELYLLDPVYDSALLYHVRSGASVYVHGHSAGGTNPALVEMMHFGMPVLAFDCEFNRYTTEDLARFFADAESLARLAQEVPDHDTAGEGAAMREIAQRRYTWAQISENYFDLMRAVAGGKHIAG